MRALLYSPFYHVLGGGERVFVAMVGALRPIVDQIDVIVDNLPDPVRRNRLGFPDIDLIQATPAAVTAATADADLFVTVANGFPVRSCAQHNLAYVQFPFETFDVRPAIRRVQQQRFEDFELLCNSEFTKLWIKERWQRDATVVYPPADAGSSAVRERTNSIVAVGRFFQSEHAKRQDVLIDAFRRLNAVEPGWRLVILGGVFDEDGARYVAALRQMADGLSVEIVVDATPESIERALSDATFFWHATGFGRSEASPEQAEHFGIATVEAMGRGAVPLVFDDGGQVEIVTADVGHRWTTVDDLVRATRSMINDPVRTRQLSANARIAAARFAPSAFTTSFPRTAAQLMERSTSASWLDGRYRRFARVAASWSNEVDDLVTQVLGAQKQLQRMDEELDRQRVALAEAVNKVERHGSGSSIS